MRRRSIVVPPPGTVSKGPSKRPGHDLTKLTAQGVFVDIGDDRTQDLDDLLWGDVGHRVNPRPHPLQKRLRVPRSEGILDLIVLAHAGRPVEPLGIIGSDTGDGGRRKHPVRKQRSAGKRVRSASGPTRGDETIGAEVIGEGRDVLRATSGSWQNAICPSDEGSVLSAKFDLVRGEMAWRQERSSAYTT